MHPYSPYRGDNKKACYDSRHQKMDDGTYRSCLCRHLKLTGGLHCDLTKERLTRHERPMPPGTSVDVWVPCSASCNGMLAEYTGKGGRTPSI